MGAPMKTIKHIAISGLVLVLLLGTLPACKRSQSEPPDPLGPSSLGIVLNLTSSNNALFAGTQRQSTTISGVLKKFDGTPISGKTVYFQVGDAAGNKLLTPPGFFDGNQTVSSRVTDSAGNVSVNYHGPLSYEIADNTDIFIWATVAWEGAQNIHASTPIQIVRDFKNIFIVVYGSPNVLFAGKNRDVSVVTAMVTITGGVPLAGKTVLFEIVNLTDYKEGEEEKKSLGYFDDNRAVAEKVIGADGSAKVNYYGPLGSELMGVNHLIGIKATVSLDGTYDEDIQIQSGTAQIQVIADATDISFNIGANPQVLYATNTRPQSEIKVIARYEGAPIANRRVYFSILSGPGFFAGNKQVAYAHTGPDGVATITYFGPTKDEIAFDQMVTIRGHLETSYPDQYDSGKTYDEVEIRIIREQ